MATKTQLIARWKDSPWSTVEQQIVKICLDYAQQPSLHEMRSTEAIFELLEGLPYRDEVEGGRDLRGSAFPGGKYLDLRNADFTYCAQIEALEHCDLFQARLDHMRGEIYSVMGHLVEASLKNARLRQTWMNASRFERCIFDEADLTSANLRNSDLRGSSFRNAKCGGADFQGCDLRGCNFRGADLSNAMFRAVTLDKTTDLRGAKLFDLVCEPIRESTGRIFMQGTDWQLATYDETTRIGSNPIATDLQILQLIIDEARQENSHWAVQLIQASQQSKRRLRADPDFKWLDALLEAIDPADRPQAQNLIERASMRL